jgi:transposase-like protein
MSKSSRRVFPRSFKLLAVRRMEGGTNVTQLAGELKVRPHMLYAWREKVRAHGPKGLRNPGRPGRAELYRSSEVVTEEARVQSAVGPPMDMASARRRIAELERKIGQQQVDLDFFRQALRQVRDARQPSGGRGELGSTRSSKR